ncbi:GNAT family N-acetyltransferase [Bacillus sp. BGMRC 2118]|nr:GNAT family N-acetyltransferase [Bacillus sp. BGMRC 2118]
MEIRPYEAKDFDHIQCLNKEEGWNNLVENDRNTKEGWEKSNIAYVVVSEDHGMIGYVRGLTDGHISLYICELLIDKRFRGIGLGKEILKYIHSEYPQTRMEMLASSSSHTYYESQGFRSFYGYRKAYGE